MDDLKCNVQMSVTVEPVFGWRWYLDKLATAGLMVLVLSYFAWCASCAHAMVEPRAGAEPAVEWRSPDEQADAAVVLEAHCPPEVRETRASGVVLSPREVLTAAHALADGETCSYTVITAQGRIVTARVVLVLRVADVARLHLDEAIDVAPVSIGEMPLLYATVCLEAGFPERRRACGFVDAFRRGAGDTGVMAPVIPGNSGSGVYDALGQLVGIVTHRRTLIDSGWFTSLERLPLTSSVGETL